MLLHEKERLKNKIIHAKLLNKRYNGNRCSCTSLPFSKQYLPNIDWIEGWMGKQRNIMVLRSIKNYLLSGCNI